MIDLDELKRHLSYDPDTGKFKWLIFSNGRRSEPGSIRRDGYISIMFEKKNYLAHRLIWFYMTGKFPDFQIDHINGLTSDNRWRNLREATNKQNQENLKIDCRNKFGLPGVTYHKRDKVFRAQIKHNGKKIWLGGFPTAELAHEAYLKAKAKYHWFNSTVDYRS